jgi:Mn-dependent DtxR family transcriptional regulator
LTDNLRGGGWIYLVHWRGYSRGKSTWETARRLWRTQHLERFLRYRPHLRPPDYHFDSDGFEATSSDSDPDCSGPGESSSDDGDDSGDYEPSQVW